MDLNFCFGLILSLIIVLGVAGNGLSMLVWIIGRRCKKLSCSVFLRGLAVSDTFALCIPALNEAFGLITGINPNHENTILCKIEVTGRHFGLMVSSWIIICFTVERTLAVFQPQRQYCYTDRKVSIIIVSFIFLVAFLINLPYAFVYQLVPVCFHNSRSSKNSTQIIKTETTIFIGEESLCDVSDVADMNLEFISDAHEMSNISSLTNASDALRQSIRSGSSCALTSQGDSTENTITQDSWTRQECDSNPSSFFNFYNWYHIWLMDFVLIFVLPFTIITISNVFVVMCIARRRKNIASTKSFRRTVAVTKRAIAVSVMHCVTAGPFSIFVLIPGLAEKAYGVKDSTEHYILSGVMIFAYLNHAVNFILYSGVYTNTGSDRIGPNYRIGPDRTRFSVLWSFFLRYFIPYAQLEEFYSIQNYFYLTLSFQ